MNKKNCFIDTSHDIIDLSDGVLGTWTVPSHNGINQMKPQMLVNRLVTGFSVTYRHHSVEYNGLAAPHYHSTVWKNKNTLPCLYFFERIPIISDDWSYMKDAASMFW